MRRLYLLPRTIREREDRMKKTFVVMAGFSAACVWFSAYVLAAGSTQNPAIHVGAIAIHFAIMAGYRDMHLMTD